MPKVSIVLPTYNGSKYIAESIQSVINQSFTDWELIIINDCSTDCTLDIANDFATRDARIKVFTNEKNLKLPASLNEGFHHANGIYYTWTSDDNRYKENALAEMVHALDTMNDVGMVYCNMDMIDENGNLVQVWNVEKAEILIEYNVIGACFLYRSDIAKKIDGYDVNLFLAEDYEYWLRIYFIAKVFKLDLNLYEYRIHSKNLTSTNKTDIILSQALKARYKHFEKIIDEINSFSKLYQFKKDLKHSHIKLQKNDLKLFKSKSKHFSFNEKLAYHFIIVTTSIKTIQRKIFSLIKKITKAILPYGFVRLIQKQKKGKG